MERRHKLIVALAIALTALAGPLLAVAGAVPVPGAPVLVVGPAAAADRDALVRAAGGAPVGPSQAPIAGFAASDSSDFADRLNRAGAWLVLDGTRLVRLCRLET